jgi:PHD/YefM family antitoxin component YafN of YafNO toxin-antitoxin module
MSDKITTLGWQEAQANLERLLDEVSEEGTIVCISGQEGRNAVLLSQSQYEQWIDVMVKALDAQPITRPDEVLFVERQSS